MTIREYDGRRASTMIALLSITDELDQLLPKVEQLRARRSELLVRGKALGLTSTELAIPTRLQPVTVRKMIKEASGA